MNKKQKGGLVMWWPEIGRATRAWDPMGEMHRLHEEMNRLFSRVSVPYAQNFSAINIWAGEEKLIVTSEIPGVDVKDIDVTVDGDVLTLSGSRKLWELGNDEGYHRQERAHGSFSRAVKLPFRVDSAAVEASYEKGVLTLTLPRPEEDKPRKIEIKSQ
jgi:HSP20 family protein